LTTVDDVAPRSWGRVLLLILRLARLGLVVPVVALIDLYALRFAAGTASWGQPLVLYRLLLAAGFTLRALPAITVLVLSPARQVLVRHTVKAVSLALLAGGAVVVWQVFSTPHLSVPHVTFSAHTPLDRVLRNLNDAAATFDTLARDLKPSP